MAKAPSDIPTASVKDAAAVAEGEGVVIQLSPEPKSAEKKPSEKTLTKFAEEKVASETKELTPAAEQKPSSLSKTKWVILEIYHRNTMQNNTSPVDVALAIINPALNLTLIYSI